MSEGNIYEENRQESNEHLLESFDIRSIAFEQLAKDGPIAVATGERGSGKSNIVRHLLFIFREILCIYLFSATETLSNDLGRTIPPCNLCKKFDEQAMRGIIAMQQRKHDDLVRQGVLSRAADLRKRIGKGGQDAIIARHELDHLNKTTKDPRIVVIFDDMMGDAKEWTNSEAVKKFFTNGRHLHIIFILNIRKVSTLQ